MVEANVAVVLGSGLTTGDLHDVVGIAEAVHFNRRVAGEVDKLRSEAVVHHDGLLELRSVVAVVNGCPSPVPRTNASAARQHSRNRVFEVVVAVVHGLVQRQVARVVHQRFRCVLAGHELHVEAFVPGRRRVVHDDHSLGGRGRVAACVCRRVGTCVHRTGTGFTFCVFVLPSHRHCTSAVGVELVECAIVFHLE